MTYTVTNKYPQGTFCWADFFSDDVEKTKALYNELFSWTSVDMPTGQPGNDYTMFYLDGKATVGGGKKPSEMKGPPFWNNYISVDDLDAMLTKAEQNGAKIMMPAMDVFDSGRMGGIEDPTGAFIMFWQPKEHIGSSVINTVGAMCWNELYTKDLQKAQDFYATLFGWTYEADETGYVTIFNNSRRNGGMMAITPEMGNFPPNWTVYFTVKNMDESLAKVKELGGQVFMQKDISVGKIGMIAEPTGATCILIEMNVEPEHWEE
jgi:predicted enzyme related to lactoylglutathione lyase